MTELEPGKIDLTRSGFTLIEVVVAMGIMGVVLLGALSLSNLTAQNQNDVYRALNWSDLQSLVIETMRNQTACNNTMAQPGVTLSSTAPVGVPNIMNAATPAGVLVHGGNTDFGSGAAKLQKVNFQLKADPNSSSWNSGDTVTADLIVNYQKPVAGGGPPLNISKTILLQVVATGPSPTSGISQCYADLLSYQQQMCASLGGTWNSGAVPPGCANLSISNALGNPAALTLNSGSLMVTGAGGYIQVGPGAPPIVPPSGVCGPGGCITSFAAKYCPKPGDSPLCTNVVGIDKGGGVMCGQPSAGPCP